MKPKYVPLAKQSKRKQKEYHAANRKDWGDINPITRKTPNLKAYNRKKSEHRHEYEPLFGFFNCAPICLPSAAASPKAA
ncbi:MAG: hypothetical protein FWD03_04145 [Defluviitaleaceae bacterium]|nr:hypothetical protein [Defluviitaleaceae bacterium]